jgi:hypothetical protein
LPAIPTVSAPTPLTPSGSIAIGNPNFTWTEPAGATKYALYVYTNATPSVVKFANYVTPACGSSTCSYYIPTLDLTAGGYKWRVRAGDASGWSAYSAWKTFTVGPPAAPTPLDPYSPIPTGNPTFTWTRPFGATKYALYVYTNATPSVMKFANYVTPTCNTYICSYTPTLNLLTTGSYKWRVRAGNTYGWSAYSTWMVFGVGSGFNSQFTGSASGWQAHWGIWSILSTAYYYSVGLSNAWSSASYTANYTNFDYQAKFSRDGGDYSCAIIFRATPGSYGSDHHWNNAYVFGIDTINSVSSYWVVKWVAGTHTSLQGWTYSAYINQGSAWNTLRVRAIGTTLYFYINGHPVLTLTDSSFASGRVGLAFYHGGAGYSYKADWATLSVLSGSSDTTRDVISPAQLSLNEAANKDPKNMLNPADYIPPK